MEVSIKNEIIINSLVLNISKKQCIDEIERHAGNNGEVRHHQCDDAHASEFSLATSSNIIQHQIEIGK
jgi:hypothetical protein